MIVQSRSLATARHERVFWPFAVASATQPDGALPVGGAVHPTVMLVRFAVNTGAAGLEGGAAPHAVMQTRPRPPASMLRSRKDAYATELTELTSASGSTSSPSPIALND